MRRTTRWYRHTVGAFATLAAAAAFAAPASGSYKAQCMLSADAKVVDKSDPGVGLRLVGGEGKYTFDSLSFGCVGDRNKDAIPEVDMIDITSGGWYSFAACGTGKLLGTVTDVRAAAPKTEYLLEGKKFAMEFLAGSGIFKWHDPTAKPVPPLDKEDPGSEDKANDAGEKDYSPAGYVQLGPPNSKFHVPNLPAGECLKAFSVTGTIVVHFDA